MARDRDEKGPVGCVLHDRATRKPLKQGVKPRWQAGEYDVTPASAQSEFSEANQRAAHADAVAKALAQFAREFVCIGSCGEDRLCTLRVVVVESESAQLVVRKVRTPEGSFQRVRLGVLEVEQRLLTLRLLVTCECACISVAPPPLPSGPAGVQIFSAAPPIVAPPLPSATGAGLGFEGKGWSVGIGAGWDMFPKIPNPPGYGQ